MEHLGIALVVALSLACSRPASTTAAPLPSSPAASEEDATDRWRCADHVECTLSCAYGAVARAWASEHIKQECSAGCASKDIEARCDDGACSAYRNGAPYPGCSQLAPDAPKKGG